MHENNRQNKTTKHFLWGLWAINGGHFDAYFSIAKTSFFAVIWGKMRYKWVDYVPEGGLRPDPRSEAMSLASHSARKKRSAAHL